MNSSIDTHRIARNFLTTKQLTQNIVSTNAVFDTSSVLISSSAIIGNNNVFYPGVVIEAPHGQTIKIGDHNIFYPGVYILCSAGSIKIGDHNEFGTGGCTIKANQPNARIDIASFGRYCDGSVIVGNTTLGAGTQVLGNIIVQSCTLDDGKPYNHPDPDYRGGVLKGFGNAKNIHLRIGEVINGQGVMLQQQVQLQRSYHPKPTLKES